MKKIFSLALALLMLIGLAACGSSAPADPALGKYCGDQMDMMGWMSMDEFFSEGENYLELKTGGKGVVCINGDDIDITWKLDGENLTVALVGLEDSERAGTLADGVVLIDLFGMDTMMCFVREGATAPNLSAGAPGDTTSTGDMAYMRQWWSGDWYGWWHIVSADGKYADMEGLWWDCLAHIDLDENGAGRLEIWDEDLPRGDGVAEVPILVDSVDGSGEMGTAFSSGGWFMDSDMEWGEWYINPVDSAFENTIEISCAMMADDGNYAYHIYLRPWGQLWDDVEAETPEDVPPGYDSWYLPLIEAGESMPDEIAIPVA